MNVEYIFSVTSITIGLYSILAGKGLLQIKWKKVVVSESKQKYKKLWIYGGAFLMIMGVIRLILAILI